MQQEEGPGGSRCRLRSRKRAARIVVTLALASGVLSAVPAQAATPATPYAPTPVNAPNPSSGGRWAERTADAGDLNGDGVHDLWVGVPRELVAGQRIGRVYAINGASLPSGTAQVLYTIDSPEPQANKNFGFFISNLGDVNHDSVSDIAVGTDAQNVYTGSGTPCGAPEPNGCNENQGKAWVFSGHNGALIYALDNPAPQGSPTHRARFGSRIGNAGDIAGRASGVTGMGIDEVIVGASGNDVPAGCSEVSPLPANCRVGQGQAFIFNGATGALVRTLNNPDQDPPAPCSSSCGSFGLAVQGPGDVNHDGIVDQLVDAGSQRADGNTGQGRMYLFSGHDGSLLARIDDPEPQANATFGFQDVSPRSPGDVNGDGYDELYANGFLQNGPAGPDQGKSWVFDGQATIASGQGVVLYEVPDPHPIEGGQFGFSMTKTDYNKDGTPDLYVGNDPHHLFPPIDQRGATNIFEGATGTHLKNLPLPPPYDAETGSTSNLGPNLGWTVSAPGDLDNDGEPDYVAGAPFTNVGSNVDQGVMIVFVSQ